MYIYFKDDANVSMESTKEETEEAKTNGDSAAEAEASEQTMDDVSCLLSYKFEPCKQLESLHIADITND